MQDQIVTYYPGPLVQTFPVSARRYVLQWSFGDSLKAGTDCRDDITYFINPFHPSTDLEEGCGHLINSSHPSSFEANCEYRSRHEAPWASIEICKAFVPKGTELFVDYHTILFDTDLLCDCTKCRTELIWDLQPKNVQQTATEASYFEKILERRRRSGFSTRICNSRSLSKKFSEVLW